MAGEFDQTGAGSELRTLLDRANAGNVFEACCRAQGNERSPKPSFRQHFKLGGNQIPLEMLRQSLPEDRVVTPGPSNVGVREQPLLQPVFAMGDAAFLQISQPTVDSGDAVFPVLTNRPTVGGPHTDSSAVAETTGAFEATILAPARLQAKFLLPAAPTAPASVRWIWA